MLDINHRPEPPELALPTGCYLTTTPKIEWEYRDNDGDMQSAYQVVIKKPDGTVIHNTGKVLSSNEYYEMITSTSPTQPGPLWASGTNEFYWKSRYGMPLIRIPIGLRVILCVGY